EIASIACADELTTGNPVAIQRDERFASGDGLEHRIVEICRQPRVHFLRQRPLQNGDKLLWRAEEIGNPQIFAKSFDLSVRECRPFLKTTSERGRQRDWSSFIATTVQTGDEETRAATVVFSQPLRRTH